MGALDLSRLCRAGGEEEIHYQEYQDIDISRLDLTLH